MKRLTILILLVFLATSCTVVRIDTSNIDNIISVVLSKNNTLYNRIGKGYKYYIPRGTSYIDTRDLNDILYNNGDYYYLYIDAIGYFYKTDINYKENNNSYYSKKFNYGEEGYLEINKKGELYAITFVYNYAKIEALVDYNSIEEVILNASYILSTVKFNDNIIELMLDEEYFTNKEEKYEIFSKTSSDDDKFLEYVEEN